MVRPLFIAEVKTHSPFGYTSDESWDALFELANTHGDWLSIHTHPSWDGSIDLVKEARRRTNKPILAKGIHTCVEDIEKCLEAGADYVLTTEYIPGRYQDRVLVELAQPVSFSLLPPHMKGVWNRRNLRDGTRKYETVADIQHCFGGWLCQASFIRTVKDVHPHADAILVGEHLRQFISTL